MTCYPRSKRASAGFTLLETLVVLVLVALVAAIAWPRVVAPSPSLLVRTSALQLAANLRSARADAMRTGLPQTIIVDMAQKTVRQNADGKPRRLASAVRISAPGSGSIIAFRSDGGSNGGQFVLDAGRQRAVVTVDWMTGATTIARRR